MSAQHTDRKDGPGRYAYSYDQILGDHPADEAPNGSRDIHGMILSAAADTATESPGSNAAGQRVTDVLENHCGGNVTVGSNPTPSAPTSENQS